MTSVLLHLRTESLEPDENREANHKVLESTRVFVQFHAQRLFNVTLIRILIVPMWSCQMRFFPTLEWAPDFSAALSVMKRADAHSWTGKRRL